MGSSKKINQILAIILAAFLGIIFRAWYLGVVQRDTLKWEAEKPKTKTLLVRAERGPIFDRFQIPLAVNRICYKASIYYNQIAQIPMSRIQDKKRVWPRKEYIRKISEKLSSVLKMDAGRIEDLIHSKASLFPHVPYIIKKDLSEEEYYQLKAIERDWPGLNAEIGGERFYPLGKTGCHIIGMMGSISRQKYQDVVDEMHMLKEVISLLEQGEAVILPQGYLSIPNVYQRLHELQEKAYTLSDLVGLSGIEGQFEEELRGYFGKKIFETDLKGRLLREMPGGKEAMNGRKITLSISAELQAFAEELLAINEADLEKRHKGEKPWIKGGAIVAFEPNTGEILALASYPRFDPNDFIKKKKNNLSQWLESEHYVASVWNGTFPLTKERFRKGFFDEEKPLTWSFYLKTILQEGSPLFLFFQKVTDVKHAIEVQEDFEKIHYLLGKQDYLVTAEIFGKKMPDITGIKPFFQRLDPLLSPLTHKDRLFALDLCRLIVDSSRFSDELIQKVGSIKLEDFKNLSMEWILLESRAKEKEKAHFHKHAFSEWREQNLKTFLNEMRKIEKEKKSYPKPFLDYLDAKEQELFTKHWAEFGYLSTIKEITSTSPLFSFSKQFSLQLMEEFCKTFRKFEELDRPLLGNYRLFKTEKDLAGSFLPKGGFGRTRSFAYQTSAPQGSVFKLITAYEGLMQGQSPVLIDNRSKDPKVVAYTLSGAPYPRLYKGGRLPRSARQYVGKIDILGALEQSSNPYFSILAGDLMKDPEDLKLAASLFGYGEKTGIDLPGETSGNLPNDLKINRTGLYSFAIGQHTLLNTPLQTACALGALCNGGKVYRPKIVLKEEGLKPDQRELAPLEIKNSPFKKELMTLGIPFSLFTGVQKKESVFQIHKKSSDLRHEIKLPQSVRNQILEGMDRTIWGEKGKARPDLIRKLKLNPLLAADFLSLKHQLIGKTGTAEIMYNYGVNPSSPAEMITHTWFSSIAFPEEKKFDNPEIVVVVFSRFSDAGKEGAPIAAQMVKKWREIKKKHFSLNSIDPTITISPLINNNF